MYKFILYMLSSTSNGRRASKGISTLFVVVHLQLGSSTWKRGRVDRHDAWTAIDFHVALRGCIFNSTAIQVPILRAEKFSIAFCGSVERFWRFKKSFQVSFDRAIRHLMAVCGRNKLLRSLLCNAERFASFLRIRESTRREN
jgi:hypothetical protein